MKQYRAAAAFEANFASSFVPVIVLLMQMPEELSESAKIEYAAAAIKEEAVKRGWLPRIVGDIRLDGPLPE